MTKVQAYGYTFEEVTEIPKGFEIWNITESELMEYIPFAQSTNNVVNRETLKVLKVDTESVNINIIKMAASRGLKKLDKMEKYARRYRNAKGRGTRFNAQLAERAAEEMRKIS